MNPGNSLTSTRMGAVFYPKASRGGTPAAHSFFNLGTSCSEIVGDYNTMIDAFYNQEFDNRYENNVRGEGTYPAAAISKLTANIRQSINDGDPKARRRIVVVLTDGNNDGDLDELRQAVSELDEVAPGVMIIAAGNDDGYRNEPQLAEMFREELTIIANGAVDHVIIRRNSTQLAIGLVKKMRDAGAICPDQGKKSVHYRNLSYGRLHPVQISYIDKLLLHMYSFPILYTT